MKIIYRISDSGYSKVKPAYINNEACLKNAIQTFPWFEHEWTILADNISEETRTMIKKYISEKFIKDVSVGHGAGTFNLALDEALREPNWQSIYFLENDYLHKPNSDKIIQEGLEYEEYGFDKYRTIHNANVNPLGQTLNRGFA
jgi:hypothetical protein